MTTRPFGWKAGVEHCPHLSDDTTAWFACVLGMPWADDGNGKVPELAQSVCRQGFSDWLAPWHTAPVEWVLLARDKTDAAAEWVDVGAAAVPVTQGLKLSAGDRSNFVDQCEARLHAYVQGHPEALGEEPQEDAFPILTYPLVSPGIALLPAHISGSILGTSALLKVARTALPANAIVVAVPVFKLSDGNATPLMDFLSDRMVRYQGPSRTVEGYDYEFHGVMVQTLEDVAFAHDPAQVDAPHQFLSVRSRAPDRQLYATLSRQFSPLRMWLWSVDQLLSKNEGPGYTGIQFCSMFVRLLGAGEDELVGADAEGSIYELVLPREMYKALFGVPHAKRREAANKMLVRFESWLSDDPDGQKSKDLLVRLAAHLDTTRLKEQRDLILAIASAVTSAQAVSADVVSAAREFYKWMEQQQGAARAGWAAWLATVLKVVTPSDGAAFVGEATEFILEGAKSGMSDASGSSGSVLDDDVLRLLNGQIDHAPDFWTVVHGDADNIDAALTAAQAHYLDAIGRRVAATQPLVVTKLAEAYANAKKAVVRAAQDDIPQADDPPLQLGFRAAADTEEQSVRGCLLALRIGVPRAADTVDWKISEWITSAWAQASQGAGTFGPVLKATGGDKAVFCDTQGSTNSDGLAEQVATYGGVPLLAAAEEKTTGPAKPEILRCIPTDKPVPPLAYGARYGGFSVTLDNAGAIIEPALRGGWPGEPVEPIPPERFEKAGATPARKAFPYLSRRPPGLPVFSRFNDWDVRQDTLSLHASGVEAGAHHVSVLFSGADYRNPSEATRKQAVKVMAPTVGRDFIARWLAADALVDKDDAFRWERVRDLTKVELEALRADSTKDKKKEFTHPAVSVVEIIFTWFAGNVKNPVHGPETIQWKLEHFNASVWTESENLELRIEQAPVRSVKLEASGKVIDIVVPKGMQVRVEARSLVGADLFDGINARLSKRALVEFDPKVARPFVANAAGNAYISRVPQVMWIESLPDVPAVADLFNIIAADFRLAMPSSGRATQELALQFRPASPRSAHWISRLEVVHKRWQWSGFPARFPADGALAPWLHLYAGTLDDMPERPSAGFTTIFDSAGNWCLDELAMKAAPLGAVRPANHMGFVVKAVPRFAKLLSRDTLKRAATTHVFGHVPGVLRPGGERLAAPVWNEAIPMPRTVTVTPHTQKLVEASRGNLLVMADPMYDTADTGAFGGIAERIELDVVTTWYESKAPPVGMVMEAGPNPIFHGAPSNTDPQPGIEIDSIFGLTYDKATGGRVAQTAIVLKPKNTQGKWTLAKCRLRRYLLPERMLDMALEGEAKAGGWTSVLGVRQVEQGWIPQDFVLYSVGAIAEVDVAGYQIRFPSDAGNFKRAYLVTWHRDRWAQAEPAWRPLVRLYERVAEFAEWALKAQVTPFELGSDYEAMGKGDGKLALSYQGTASGYRIAVSDFTESRWLTFIGSFGHAAPLGPDQIKVARADGGFVVSPATAGSLMPKLGNRTDLCPSLLLIFAPQLDLMSGRVETEGGELVGVYAANDVTGGAGIAFDEEVLPCTRDTDECQALLIQVQRHNIGAPEHVIAKDKWKELVEGLFPDEASPKEATMRFLPEYIGPMKIA